MNIAIVGAGLLGRLLAWRLLVEQSVNDTKGSQSSNTLTVSLYDKDFSCENSAAYIAAAMLAPLSELVSSEALVAVKGLAAITIWQQWAEQLKTSHHVDIDFQQRGSLLVSHAGDEAHFNFFAQSLKRDMAGLLDADLLRFVQKAELQTLEPSLAVNFNQAYFLSPEGAIDNRALLKGLDKVLEEQGVNFVECELPCQLDASAFSDFEQVVDCRGFGAKQNLQALHAQQSYSKAFRGVRGEVVRVRAPAVQLSRPVRLMHPRYQLYIAPKPNHCFVIGATEIESESESPVTLRSSMELLSALYSVDKGFSEAEVLEMSAKCRPAFADNLPAIIPPSISPSQDNFAWHVNGLYRHGFLLAPVVINQLLVGLGFLQDTAQTWPEIVYKHN